MITFLIFFWNNSSSKIFYLFTYFWCIPKFWEKPFLVSVLNGPTVQFLNGVTLKIPLQLYQSKEYPCIVIGQYPLALSWAVTIHKVQLWRQLKWILARGFLLMDNLMHHPHNFFCIHSEHWNQLT